MANPETQKVEGSQETEQQQAGTEQETQQQQEEKLYAGRFKTPEELENAYKLSSGEGVRLSQEVKRLNTLLQQAKTPQQKEAIQDKIDDLTKHFDPETAKILTSYIENKLTEFTTTQERNREFTGQVTEVWEETKKLFPEVADPNSKLYKRANEILFERNLASVSQDGTITLLTPFAYRIAVEAASLELGRQTQENAGTKEKKNLTGTIQGKGSKSYGGGKLTYEQYQKLSDDEKDAYDHQTTGK